MELLTFKVKNSRYVHLSRGVSLGVLVGGQIEFEKMLERGVTPFRKIVGDGLGYCPFLKEQEPRDRRNAEGGN